MNTKFGGHLGWMEGLHEMHWSMKAAFEYFGAHMADLT